MTANTASVVNSETQHSPELVGAELIVAKTNKFREEQGLMPVEINTQLANAARYFADYMAGTDQHSHTADGKTPSERASEHGYDYCLVAENIAYVYRSAGYGTEELADQFVEIWKESPEHRTNMLHPFIAEIGVAVAQSGRTGNFYGVQMFGRPKSLSFQFFVENQSDVRIEYSVGEHGYELLPLNRYTHEACLPANLTFQLPREAPQRRVFQPQADDYFYIVGSADDLEIRKK